MEFLFCRQSLSDSVAVIALEFTKNQKKWLLNHNEEHFRPPVDATPLEKREFFLQVWNKFSMAFPDNTFETSRSGSESDLFRHSVWGRVGPFSC